ncbi:secreted effector protein PipB2 [Candidatus Phycosocius bacilliformis]|uniref:Secreted effector protein PipB2 n=1 Tax=Candidatus Phycosocius bacilliformis TaxID=1445552 RepID=A0A2P2E8C2_9PROT|nr:pentapeptide repeat-containing protein [Candidatus Phycosocius bacilliformis]GBF57312.1 secreted effector protein PipB2 [Candidatus Phycosocius bacilliformis]
MKRLSLALLAAVAVSAPALAQNAAQIDRVKGGQSCSGCNLFQADLSYSDLSRRNFSGSRLRQSEMSLATADGANFSRADLSIANLYGVRATGASFARTNLERAVLVGGYFSGANFAGANLTGANLSGAEMAGARGLTQTQLSKACGDATTTLPRGLSVPACQ